MARRSTDWHISGLPAILLAPIAFPLALLAGFLPKKSRDRTPEDVAGFIRDFLAGTGGNWDWDDFTSIPITAVELEAIREEADLVPLPLTSKGRARLESLLARAEALIPGSSDPVSV